MAAWWLSQVLAKSSARNWKPQVWLTLFRKYDWGCTVNECENVDKYPMWRCDIGWKYPWEVKNLYVEIQQCTVDDAEKARGSEEAKILEKKISPSTQPFDAPQNSSTVCILDILICSIAALYSRLYELKSSSANSRRTCSFSINFTKMLHVFLTFQLCLKLSIRRSFNILILKWGHCDSIQFFCWIIIA